MAGLITRGNVYYAVYYVGKKQKRISLDTSSVQFAKEKLRQLESSLYRGDDNPLPLKPLFPRSLPSTLQTCVRERPPRVSRGTSITFVRPLSPSALTLSLKGKKRPSSYPSACIEATFFEQISTADFANFISTQVRRKALAPKTANRYREVLTRLYNWAMTQNGIRMPGGKNPAAKVESYKERASAISFLTLEQIEAQLAALDGHPKLQVIVAVYIYAGLRREELCWLTVDDLDFSAGSNGMIRICAKTINGTF